MAGYIGTTKSVAIVDGATGDQGALADTAVQPNDNVTLGEVTATSFSGDGSALTGVNAFKPTTVSGASQTLDIGTYNFFDAGTLAEDTTLTFSNVPTTAKWSYVYTPAASSAYALSTATQMASTAVVAGVYYGLCFSSDGLKMFVMTSSGDYVYEYDLPSPFYVDGAVDTGLQIIFGTDPRDIYLSPDGANFYVIDYAAKTVKRYAMGTKNSFSAGVTYLNEFNVSAQTGAPSGVTFSPDGLMMFVSSSSRIYKYTLSTRWDITTAVFDSSSPSSSYVHDVEFSADGTKLIALDQSNDLVRVWTMSTPWDVTTLTSTSETLSTGTEATPQTIASDPLGTVVFVLGYTNDTVVQYSCGAFSSLTLPNSVYNPTTSRGNYSSKTLLEFYTDDGGSTVYLINEARV